MRRSITILILAAIMIVCLSSCGIDSSNTNSVNNVRDERQVILDKINEEVDAVVELLSVELQTVYNSVGETYDGYKENKQRLTAWYDLVETETETLLENTMNYSYDYYTTLVATVDMNDSVDVYNAMDEFLDVVHQKTFDKIYEAVYDEMFNEIYNKYYDGIIADAMNEAEYGEWLSESVECLDAWTNARSGFYEEWLETKTDIYDDWFKVKTEFYNDNFDIKSILD